MTNSIYLLTPDSLCDQITVLNLSFPGETFVVSQRWFSAVVKYNLWHDMYFDVVVSQHLHTPLAPELLVSEPP